MSDLDFLFTMKLAGRDAFDHVLNDVAGTIFRYAGCSSTVVADLIDELNGALVPGADNGVGVDVQFRAHGGTCEVIVFVRDREIWRAARPIP